MSELTPQDELKQITEQLSFFRERQRELKAQLHVDSDEMKQAKADARARIANYRAAANDNKKSVVTILRKLTPVLRSGNVDTMVSFIELLEEANTQLALSVTLFASATEDLEELKAGNFPAHMLEDEDEL